MKITPRDLFTLRTAEFSPCRSYRYSLRIVWDDSLPLAAFVGLNPSTADEYVDDNTIRRERLFACDWGCGGIFKLNAFAWRATRPAEMRRQADPIGPLNTIEFMRASLDLCRGPLVACWGRHGTFMDRGEYLRRELPPMQCFGVNSDGTPKHPLYLPSDSILIAYQSATTTPL